MKLAQPVRIAYAVGTIKFLLKFLHFFPFAFLGLKRLKIWLIKVFYVIQLGSNEYFWQRSVATD